MNKPIISVIIPTYNNAAYLCEAIDSVLAQTYKDFEVIVIDDGSTDNTREMVKKYDGKIRYLFQENKGVSAARNIGIKMAIGDYIALLDDDDSWLTDKLLLQVFAIEANPEIAMVFTDVEAFDEKGIVNSSFGRPSNPMLFDKEEFRYKMAKTTFDDGAVLKGNIYKDLLKCNMIVPTTALIKKRVFDIVGYFDNNLPVNQDYDLWIRISKRYPVLYLNKLTARYRVRDKSISGKMGLREYRYREHDAEMLKKHLNTGSQKDKSFLRKRILDCYKIAVWGYLNLSDFKKARILCFRSLVFKKFQPKLYLYILSLFFLLMSLCS